MSAPRVSAVVVSWNTRDELLACLASLRDEPGVEIVVVDNASSDGSVDAVRETFPEARLIESPTNAGFAGGCNRGLEAARAARILFLNSDAELRPGALEALERALDARPDAALAGPRTLNADLTPQLSWGPALTPLAEWRQRRRVRAVRARDPRALAEVDAESRRPREPDWVSGSCMLARREALDAVGGFDEGFFLYEEDVDLCVRLRAAGWTVLFVPDAEVVHRLGRSTARAPVRVRLEYHRSHLRYYRRHGSVVGRALIRGLLLARGLLGWLAAAGPGAARREERRASARELELALRGR